MSKKLITGSINLTALQHVAMEMKGKSGMVQGIFIPLDTNKLKTHENENVYLNLVGFEMDEEKEYATHIVKQSLSKEEREAMSEEEQRAMPILGNLKVGSGAPVEKNNNAASGKVFNPAKDDLPF